MNKKPLGVAVGVAVAMLSTSALAVSLYGNNTQKGSLLVFPRIEVTRHADTLIRITNDSNSPVLLKCYWATTEDADSGNVDKISKKHKTNFTIDVTRTQPLHFWASDGQSQGSWNSRYPVNVHPFTPFADGYDAEAGELKCWAVNANNEPVRHNHLVGVATVYDTSNRQSYEYTATTFQGLPVLGPTGGALGLINQPSEIPGVTELYNELPLDGTDGNYDKCPQVALGSISPVGTRLSLRGGWHDDSFGWGEASGSQITLVGCNQDLREAYTPYITKIRYTFFNMDESAISGVDQCADSWYEQDLGHFEGARYAAANTDSVYFRAEAVGNPQQCKGSKAGGLYGIIVNSVYDTKERAFDLDADQDLRRASRTYVSGTTLNGRGGVNGSIKYDSGDGDVIGKK